MRMPSTAPLIGVTSYRSVRNDSATTYQVSQPYIDAILRAGGIPLVIPTSMPVDRLDELFFHLSGVMLTGGADINPDLFGGKPHSAVYDIDEIRDTLEIHLVKKASEAGLPFLGICRGIQVINVALDGTLYTDIRDQVPGALKHDHYPNIPRDYLAHSITIEPNCSLAEILGATEVEVNSLHHQAIEKLAPSLRPLAYSPDQLVEAVELPGHPFGFGVQWHPESLPALPAQQRIFKSFIRAAAK
jgi:putative glutamine amidotransferase